MGRRPGKGEGRRKPGALLVVRPSRAVPAGLFFGPALGLFTGGESGFDCCGRIA